MVFDGGHDELQFLGANALAVVLAVFTALQKVVRALREGLAAAVDLIGLFAHVTANHAVNVSHFFEDPGAFLLEGDCEHRWIR
jgi:hypothetical protein